MFLGRSVFNQVELDNRNAALTIEDTPGISPVEEEIYWWPYIGSQGQFVLEPTSIPTSYPGLSVYETSVHSNLTTTIELGVHAIREEESAIDELLSSRVSHRNPEAVRTYLARYPEIENFLKAAWPALVRCFGGPVDIILEVMAYPEEATYEELVGWIQSTDSVYEGLEKLELFPGLATGWHLGNLQRNVELWE